MRRSIVVVSCTLALLVTSVRAQVAVTPDYDPYMLDSNFEDAPDIDAHRDDYELFCPDLEPGDLLIFDAHVVHGSSSNASSDRPRRASRGRSVVHLSG